MLGITASICRQGESEGGEGKERVAVLGREGAEDLWQQIESNRIEPATTLVCTSNKIKDTTVPSAQVGNL